MADDGQPGGPAEDGTLDEGLESGTADSGAGGGTGVGGGTGGELLGLDCRGSAEAGGTAAGVRFELADWLDWDKYSRL